MVKTEFGNLALVVGQNLKAYISHHAFLRGTSCLQLLNPVPKVLAQVL